MKKNIKWNKWLILPFSIILVVFVLVVGNSILTSIIQKKIGQAIRQLSPKADVHYVSIHANLFSSSASIDDLDIHFIPYRTAPQYQHSLHFNNVSLTGINFFKVILSNTLSIRNVSFNKAQVNLDAFLLDKKDSGQSLTSDLHVPFKNLAIDKLQFSEINVWLHVAGPDKLLFKGNITLHGAEIKSTNKSGATTRFSFKSVEGLLSDIHYAMPHDRYAIHVKKLMVNSNKQSLLLDSLKIVADTNPYAAAYKTADTNMNEATAATIEVTKLNVLQLLPLLSDDKALHEKYQTAILLSDVHAHFMQNDKGHLLGNSFYCKRLSSEGIDFAKAILKDSLFVNTIKIEGCEIKLDRNLLDKITTSKEKILARMDIPFKNVSVNKFMISEANIRLHSMNEERLLLKGDVTINKAILNDTGPYGNKEFHFGAIACNLSDIHYPLPGGLYVMDINKVIADSKTATLRISSLKMIPLYDKYELGKILGRQQDWINSSVGNIQISKLNYADMPSKKLRADKITFNNWRIYVFRDRRLPRPLKQQPMPDDYLKRIPLEIRVNHLQVNNASVIYEEFPKDGTQPGTLQFQNMNISISPILNHPYKTDPVYADTYVRGSIMNSGSIMAMIHASLTKNIYYIKGAIENLDLSRLNSSAENLGKFHIQSGILNSLDFHFTATDKKSTGEIVGEYHNLIIERLKVRHGVKKVAKVPTFFLKHIIIPKNKDKSMAVSKRTGKIDYNRDSTRMVTFYLLKSLLSGIRASFKFGFLLPE